MLTSRFIRWMGTVFSLVVATAVLSDAGTVKPSEPETKENCVASGDAEGVCTPYYNCHDERTDGMFIEHTCEKDLDVCCPADSILSDDKLPKSTSKRAVNNGTQWKRRGCGKTNPNGVGPSEIGGGKDGQAKFGEFPWMAAIPILSTSNSSQLMRCGASLIHPRVAVTLRRCVFDEDEDLRAGDWNVGAINETLPYQQKKIAKVIFHEGYENNRRGRKNDIALLILEDEFEEAENIGVICLPPPGPEAPATRCLLSGWGTTPQQRFPVDVLKKVELPIVDRVTCKKNLSSFATMVDESFICAGGERGFDSCRGDSGSPLACPYAEHLYKYMLSGVVSWGNGECGIGLPAGYSNIAFHREWIDAKLEENNIDMTPFAPFNISL